MNRADFMRNLAELLADVSPAEREEAMQYYNDYFDDAGAENEQSVIASLGTPEQLARTIKAGLADGGNMGEFTEKGFSGYEQRKWNEVLNPDRPVEENGGPFQGEGNSESWQNGGNAHYFQQENNGYSGCQNSYEAEKNSEEKKNKQMSGGTIVLIIFLCILASPMLLGLGGGLFGGALGVLGGLLGILVGFGVAAVALLIGGVSLFVAGIVMMFSAPLGGLCMLGAAMICLALGIFFLWLAVMVCGVLLPAIIKGIVKLFQSIFHKGGAKA